MDKSPVMLAPAYKDNIWGGTRLKTEYGKVCDFDRVAESWELSAHKDGESTVSNGNFKGMKLSEYIKANGKDTLGDDANKFEFFPILIKLIDACDKLSVQVHPSDEYALKNEGEYGKTEMWYVVDCESGAYLYYGVKEPITKEEFAKCIKDNTVCDVLNKVEVKKGDVFFINSGTIHAIGAGILICEIQQNSNTTYRVYDYDRRDKNGNPRQLHIEKALEVSDFNPPENYTFDGDMLAQCKYFTVRKLDVFGEKTFELTKTSFRSVIILSGNAELTVGNAKLSVKKGDSVFIPAQDGEARLSGECQAILSYV